MPDAVGKLQLRKFTAFLTRGGVPTNRNSSATAPKKVYIVSNKGEACAVITKINQKCGNYANCGIIINPSLFVEITQIAEMS